MDAKDAKQTILKIFISLKVHEMGKYSSLISFKLKT